MEEKKHDNLWVRTVSENFQNYLSAMALEMIEHSKAERIGTVSHSQKENRKREKVSQSTNHEIHYNKVLF